MRNKFLLDSANLDSIERLSNIGAIDGVTTNPSLMAKENLSKDEYYNHLHKIVGILSSNKDGFHFSYEIDSLDIIEISQKALCFVEKEKLFSRFLNLKVPALMKYSGFISEKSSIFNINATGIATYMQALFAIESGAKVVSFFYNRAIDYINNVEKSNNTHFFMGAKESLEAEIRSTREYIDENELDVKIICGSIRTKRNVLDCFLAGADYVTCSEKVIYECVDHPVTIESVNRFQKDIEDSYNKKDIT